MAPHFQLQALELKTLPRRIDRRALRKHLRTLNGRYAPLFSFTQMRAIFQRELAQHGGQIQRGKLTWQLDVPDAGTILRFVRVDARTWQQQNLSGW